MASSCLTWALMLLSAMALSWVVVLVKLVLGGVGIKKRPEKCRQTFEGMVYYRHQGGNMNATMTKNSYRGLDNHIMPRGWNVSLQGVGGVLMGLPRSWAEKAVRLLNECEGDAEIRAEMLRIRRALGDI